MDKPDVEEIEVMMERSQIKEGKHGTVVVGALPLLRAQVGVNVAIKVPALEAPGVLLPLSNRIALVPVAQLCL